jgi:iron complex outermembrane receptor protein
LLVFGAPLLAQPATAPAQPPETVVVTGTWAPIPLEEADRAIHVINTQDLHLISSTFFDLLQLDSSLDLMPRAPNGIQADLSIRGSSFGQTLILLDGLRLNDSQSGHHNLDLPLPLDAISQAQILRGTGSTFYGSDAVGGVVNFITRQPEASEIRLGVALGNFGQNQERGVLAWVGGPLAEQFTFSRDFSTGFLPDRDYRDLSLASVTHWTNRLGATGLTFAMSDRPFGADQFYGNFPSWERTRGWYAALHQTLGKKTELDFSFRRHTDLFILFRYAPEIYTNRHALESYQAAARRSEELGRTMSLHYGVEGYHDGIDSSNLGNHDRTWGAGYLAFDARALRRFSFSAGLRDELYGGTKNQLSPSVSGGVWLSSKIKLRANVSRAFRLPSFTDLYYHDPANVGNPNLLPEKAWGGEAGLDFYPGARWTASATVFQRRERDVIDYVRYSPTDVWRATNFDRLRFTGIEATFRTMLARRNTIEVSYTGIHGAQNALAGAISRYVFNYPIHEGIAQWQSSWRHDLLTRVRVGALERFARDPYAVLDLYAAWAHGRVRPFFQLTNATNTIYQEIQGVQMPTRSVLGGLEFKVL